MVQDKELHYRSKEEIRLFQEACLRETIAYVADRSAFYRRLFEEHQIDPASIRTLEDLKRLPLTSKEDLQLHGEDFVCVGKREIIDYVTTSGTLGDPVTFALTEGDLERLAYNEACSFRMAGCTEEDVMQLMTTIDRRFMAGLAYFLGARKLGCGVVRVGNGIPELQWDTIRRVGSTACMVVPSFLMKLIEFAEKSGFDPNRSTLRKAICIGETLRTPDGKLTKLAEKISARWPQLELYSTYASTEMQSSFTECEHHAGGHIPADLIIVELLDENGAPVAAGEAGEVTITTLGVEGMTADLLYDLLSPYADGSGEAREAENPLSKVDFYVDGLSGGPNATARRNELAQKLNLPQGMTANALLAAVRLLCTYEEYLKLVGRKSND